MSVSRFWVGLFSVGCLALSALEGRAGAQGADPPPGPAGPDPGPPPAAAEPPPASPLSPAATGLAETPSWDSPAPAEPPRTLADESFETGAATDAPLDVPPEATAPDEDARLASLAETSGSQGATGLMRVMSAGSAAPGTFRVSLVTGFYSGTGFLCPECPDDQGADSSVPDDVDRVVANLYLSATPTPFLEAYAGIFSNSTSTNRTQNQLKQVVGDWMLGVKAFTPDDPQQIFSFGGALDLGFSTGSGQVGVSGIDSIDLGIRGLASADLSKRAGKSIPLRAHANLGYLFDNSGKLVEDFERDNLDIDRIDRFTLGVNKVDFVQFGLGVEGLFDTARPYLEWSIDIPANRQGYRCDRAATRSGEACLEDRGQFSTTPSRLSTGVRVMPWPAIPWWLEGLTLTGALDIATGGTSDFLVEVAPEVPWMLWFGVGFAADTHPRIQIERMPAPVVMSGERDLLIEGRVVEQETETGIGDAEIRFEGRELTGMISKADGQFTSSALEPGRYTLRVKAEGYRDGSCSVDVKPPTDVALDPLGIGPTEPPPPTVASGPAASAGQQPVTHAITCALEPLPKVSNLYGHVTDASTGEPVGNAVARITDVLGRFLELRVDDVGSFGFLNIPPGVANLSVKADGYLTSVTRIEVKPLEEIEKRFVLNPTPDKSGIKRDGKVLSLSRPIQFGDGSAELSLEALATIQELAPFLLDHADLGRIEVQSHTADSGALANSLSSDRAGAVRDALILHGVPAAMLTARGYGGSQPRDPGDGQRARERNERIVFQLVSP